MSEVPIESLVPNNYNPRKHFDTASMMELQRSIETQGLIQPITVRPIEGDKYEVVCGVRRFIACQRIPLKKIPCMILKLSDEEAKLISITENLERANLTPMEEARSFKTYLGWDLPRNFEGKPQEGMESKIIEFSMKIPMSKDTVYNRLSLLHLPEKVQVMLVNKDLDLGAAYEIVKLKGLWKIKTAGMSEELIEAQRETIRKGIQDTMLDVAETYGGVLERLRERITNILEAEKKEIGARETLLENLRIARDKAREALEEKINEVIEEVGAEAEYGQFRRAVFDVLSGAEEPMLWSELRDKSDVLQREEPYLELVQKLEEDIDLLRVETDRGVVWSLGEGVKLEEEEERAVTEVAEGIIGVFNEELKEIEEIRRIGAEKVKIQEQLDRYGLNRAFVKESVIDYCPYCGAGVEIDNLERRIEEAKEKIEELDKEEKAISEEKARIRDARTRLVKLLDTFTVKKKSFDDQLRSLGKVEE